jgi:hypothetical protein
VVFKPGNIYKGTKLTTQVAGGNIMIGKQLPFTNLLKFNPAYSLLKYHGVAGVNIRWLLHGVTVPS